MSEFTQPSGAYVMENGEMKLAPAQEKKHSPWEYRIVDGKDQNMFLDAVTEAGSDGWELVHIEPMHGYLIGFMKRGVV